VKRPSGLTLILGATGIAAVCGYLVIWFVPVQIGLAAYKPFGLFWAAMYLLVSALSGVQQEVTRATVPRSPSRAATANPARNFGVALAGVVFVIVVASSPLWVDAVFPGEGFALVPPLAVAAASYVLVATLAGTLYGISGWVPLALMVAVDALLRLVAVVAVAAVTSDTVTLAWAAATPFLLTIVLLWPAVRRGVVGRTWVDVGYRALSWNVTRTVAASASMGLLVSGFPVLIGLASAGEQAAFVASLFLAIMITRAPVIVLVMSLQSYLVVRFRDRRKEGFWRQFLLIQAAIAGGGVVLAVVAAFIGPAVFEWLYGSEFDLDGWFYAVLVVSSALVGALVVSAAAVLADSQHLVYSLGWLIAAAVTLGCFLLPADLLTRTVVALIAGPVAGLVVHGSHLLVRQGRVRQAAT